MLSEIKKKKCCQETQVQHYRQVWVAWKLLGYGSAPEQDPPQPWRQTYLHQEESPSEAGTHNDKTFYQV